MTGEIPQSETGPGRSWRTAITTALPPRHLGVFIGKDTLTVAVSHRTTRGARPRVILQEHLPDGAGSEAITELFLHLRECWPARRLVSNVAISMPTARVKILPLPGLSRPALRQMAALGTQRFFFRPDGPQLTDAIRVGPRKLGAPSPVLIASAAESAVSAIRVAAESAGVLVERVEPASVALVRAASTLLPGLRSGDVAIVSRMSGGAEVAFLCRGRIVALRTRPEGNFVRSVTDWLCELSPLIAEAVDAYRMDLRLVALLGSTGEAVPDSLSLPGGASCPIRVVEPGLSAEVVGAWGAASIPSSGPLLLPEPRRRALQIAQVRSAVAFVACALLLLSGAAFFHLRTLDRRLAELRHTRSVMRPAVVKAEAIGTSLGGLRARTAALHGLEAESVRWPHLVAVISDVLPNDSYLTSLQADGLRLRLEGEAPSAAALAARLDSSPLFERVDLSPAQRTDTPAGPRERFRIEVTFVPPAAPASHDSTAPLSPADSVNHEGGGARVSLRGGSDR